MKNTYHDIAAVVILLFAVQAAVPLTHARRPARQASSTKSHTSAPAPAPASAPTESAPVEPAPAESAPTLPQTPAAAPTSTPVPPESPRPSSGASADLGLSDQISLEAARKTEVRFTKTIQTKKAALVEKAIARSTVFLQKGPFEQAARAAATAYVFDPQAQFLFTMARAYHKAEQERAALVLYERFLKEDPQSPLSAQVGDYAAGLRARLGDSGDVSEQLFREHLDLGKRYYQGAQYRQAAEVYCIAYALQRSARSLFNVAQTYRRGGQMEAAYVIYQRFLQEDPATPIRRETEGYLGDLRSQISNPSSSKRAWIGGTIAGVLGIGLGLAIGLGLSAARSTDPPTDGGFVKVHF